MPQIPDGEGRIGTCTGRKGIGSHPQVPKLMGNTTHEMIHAGLGAYVGGVINEYDARGDRRTLIDRSPLGMHRSSAWKCWKGPAGGVDTTAPTEYDGVETTGPDALP